MLKEQKRLYDLGFAIHLLRPKSKVPLLSGWTKGPREAWASLEKNFKNGMNVGVRLGEPSKVGDGFLAVLDIDVKSKNPRHRREAYEFIRAIGGIDDKVAVLTGRGQGSLHIYGLTRASVSTRRLCQSSEVVKVELPSADKPSKRERDILSEDEIKKGIRLRPAWEVSLMGTGSQVVLPPSIHPDTGLRYHWRDANSTPATSELPLFPDSIMGMESLKPGGVVGANAKAGEDFKADDTVDLVTSSLSDKIVGQILNGEGVEDRSAALYGVCLTMIRNGFTDNQIASVLTNRTYFLGQVAYDHAKTDKRARAAKWVLEQNVAKARKQLDAANVFDCEVDVTELNDQEAEEQFVAIVEKQDWRDNIERTTGPESKPKSTMKNVVTILRGELGDSIFRKNLFSGLEIFGRVVPQWGAREGAEITDTNVIRIKKWIADKYRFEPATDKINEAIQIIAAENAFHPVKDYFDTLEWDGVPRIDTWLKDYANAKAEEPYLSAVSRKTLVAMVARIYLPGIKFDTVLILQGNQGYGKSTLLRNLAGDEWFSDALINVHDKDAVLALRAVWLQELGELAGMRKADAEILKAFLSRKTDRIRVPYGRRTESFPRQGIFVGSTNAEEYLTDPTGSRRFWPVKVGKCEFERIKEDRDQLWAEAKFAYDLGEPIYLEGAEENAAALREQDARFVADELTEKLLKFFKTEAKKPANERFPFEQFKMLDLFGDDATSSLNPLAGVVRFDPAGQKRVGEALRKIGAVNVLQRVDGRVTRFWKWDAGAK